MSSTLFSREVVQRLFPNGDSGWGPVPSTRLLYAWAWYEQLKKDVQVLLRVGPQFVLCHEKREGKRKVQEKLATFVNAQATLAEDLIIFCKRRK